MNKATHANLLWFLPQVETTARPYASRSASARLRCLQLLPHLTQSFDIRLIDMAPASIQLEASWLDACDIAVFGKMFRNVESVIQYLRSKKKKIVVDLCDPVLDDPALRPLYIPMLRNADMVVTATRQLQSRLADQGVSSYLIEDTIETNRTPVDHPSRDRQRAVWFGSPKNHPEIETVCTVLKAHAPHLTLDVVTHFAKPDQQHKAESWLAASGLQWQFTEWSRESQHQRLTEAGIAILPSRNGLSSHNRITSALLAGAWPVAHAVEGFLSFQDHAWLGDHLGAGITDYLAHPEAVAQKIEAAQALIIDKYSPEACGGSWTRLLKSL